MLQITKKLLIEQHSINFDNFIVLTLLLIHGMNMLQNSPEQHKCHLGKNQTNKLLHILLSLVQSKMHTQCRNNIFQPCYYTEMSQVTKVIVYFRNVIVTLMSYFLNVTFPTSAVCKNNASLFVECILYA